FINFAENPDEKMILDMMQSFATRDIKYNFMVDAMMIANIDGAFDDAKHAIITQYFEMFKITKAEEQDLRYIYEMFDRQDGNALFRYFGKKDKNTIHIIKPELFQYLLDYYKIDMAYELQEEEKKILNFEFFKPTFERGELGDNATEIMTKPVSNAQFCLFLNAIFMAKEIEFDGNGKIVDSESKDFLMGLDHSDIEFEDEKFIVDQTNDDKKVTGLTSVAVEAFVEWASAIANVEYDCSAFYGVKYSNVSTDVNHPIFTAAALAQMYSSNTRTRDKCFFSVDSFKEHPISLEFFWNTADSDSINSWSIAPEDTTDYFDVNDCAAKDQNYQSKETSFRLMKLPEESK
ncbi:MAG: hypothetical protein Q9M28_10480, partial [Mariprofundaceae bacterium]|nr:hypothetical protein [Mariprofundaceae bacterium]